MARNIVPPRITPGDRRTTRLRWTTIAGSLLASALLLPVVGRAASTCPTVAVFDPALGASSADAGWTGLGHDHPLFGVTLALAIDCAVSEPPCGTCPVTGLLPNAQGMVQRCRADTSIACTSATEVADCGGVDTCAVFLTPPQPVAAGGISSCYVQELTSAPSGTADVESGALAVTLAFENRLSLGISFTAGCPQCVGDPFANDGVRNGTCNGGPRHGLACDGHGPSVPPYDDYGTSSFDCPSTPTALIGTFTYPPVTFSTGTQSRTLTAASPDCSGQPGSKCFCQTCNNGNAEPCAADADCPDPDGPAGPICGGRRCVDGANAGAPCAVASECPGGSCLTPGEPPRPHSCLEDTTTPELARICDDTPPVGDGKGHCAVGPFLTYCTNHPNRSCASDADCNGVPGACESQSFPCFVTTGAIGDTLPVTGVATPPAHDVADPTALGMLTCVGAVESAAVNNIGGFPGLGRNVHVGRLTFADAPGPAPSCPPAPDACRTPAVAGKSSLVIGNRTPDGKDKLGWSWAKGAATTIADLGNPTGTDHYDLCLYDTNGLRAAFVIPGGGLCDGRPCWKATSKGFIYKSKSGSPRGITKLTLKSGEAQKASIRVAGKGDFVLLPDLPMLQAPLQMQLRHRPSGLCWSATYAAPFKRFTPTDLQATD